MPATTIAVIEGDGIGKEVVPEGRRVLEAAARVFGLDLRFEAFPWGCDHHARFGRMMPEDGLARIADHDAIFLGAVGWPTVSDVEPLWTLLMPIRRSFQQYVNLRPVRLFEGVPSPLARPGDIDLLIVRELRNLHRGIPDFGNSANLHAGKLGLQIITQPSVQIRAQFVHV